MIGGDFQNTPQEVQHRMARWLQKIGGEVAAPGNLTCRSVHGGRTIDFFIVDLRITEGVQGVWVQFDFPSSPHYIVVLRLRITAGTGQYMKVIAPKPFEAAPPTGCQRKPAYETSCLKLVKDMSSEGEINEAFRMMTERSEKHLCGVFDCVLPDGSPDKKFIGRGEFLERKWRAVLPPQAKELGQASGAMLAISLVHSRLCELAALLFRHNTYSLLTGIL